MKVTDFCTSIPDEKLGLSNGSGISAKPYKSSSRVRVWVRVRVRVRVKVKVRV